MDADSIVKGIVEKACEDYDTGKLRTINVRAAFGDGGYLTFKEHIIAERAARLAFVAGMREAAKIAKGVDEASLCMSCTDTSRIHDAIVAATDAIERGGGAAMTLSPADPAGR